MSKKIYTQTKNKLRLEMHRLPSVEKLQKNKCTWI